MNKSTKWGCLAVTTVVTVLAATWFFVVWDRSTLNYRLTLNIDTPAGLASGSSVVEVSWEDTTALPLPNTGVGHSIAGEAVVVDLGSDKYLFSLLKGPSKATPNGLVLTGFDPGRRWSVLEDRKFNRVVEYVEYLSRVKPRVVLEKGPYPLLVTFDDIDDPASVKRVDPNNLDAAFGCPSVAGQAEQSDAPARERTVARTGERKTDQCYALKSITLEITDEPVTAGRVEEVLGWLDNHKGRIKPTNKKYADELTVEENLYRGDFIKGN